MHKRPKLSSRDLKKRLAYLALLKRKQWWTAEEAAEYLERSVYYVDAQFRAGHLKRNRENLTCLRWVEEYLKDPIRGMYRSNLAKG